MHPANAPSQSFPALQPRNGQPVGSSHGVEGDITPAELAHELNSSLDGSMRNLRFALTLAEASATSEEINAHIRRALGAMTTMAGVLEQVMNATELQINVFDQTETLQKTVEQAIESLYVMARANRVEVR